MSASNPKIKRAASSSPPLEPSSKMDTINGVFECYNFLSPNEYSDKTFGIPAFILRKSVGEINFSDIIDKVEKRYQLKQQIDYAALLDDKRRNLNDIDASIEKCLMLNRLITYLIENESQFLSLISDIFIDMRMKITDNVQNENIDYPNGFRQREQDFKRRQEAQNIRRLFYYSDIEAKQPPNIIHLIKITTDHLSYLTDCKMRYDAHFRDIGLKELEKIFLTSFMILKQPHCGLNPVLIYERRGNGQCIAKVSIMIVSLLYDFMQSHPQFIELFDIETSLVPSSPVYKLAPTPISWKTCRLQIDSYDKPRMIQYAKLSQLTIQYSTKSNTRIRLGDELHKLKFNIKLRLNLREYRFTKTYEISLESLDFGIVSHNSYISHSLTKILLSDIRRYTQCSIVDDRHILNFMLRYFSHRTGVCYSQCLKNYLEKELYKAKNEKRNFQTVENIYMDFLVPFVNQVEFMGKHPILSMLYADSLFLGTCDSEQAAQIMKNSTITNTPIVGLRFNSIKVDYKANLSGPATSKTVKPIPCAVRVDIYNDRRKNLQYRTFDTSMLIFDIKKFVCAAHKEHGKRINILSNLEDQLGISNLKSFKDFDKYFHDRLDRFHREEEDYKHVTELLYDIEEDDDNNHENQQQVESSNATVLTEIFSENPSSQPFAPVKPCNNNFSSISVNHQTDISTIGTHSTAYPVSVQQQSMSEQDMIQYICSRPELVKQVLDRSRNLQVNSLTTQTFQHYSNHQTPFSYQSQFIYQPSTTQMQYSTQLNNTQSMEQSSTSFLSTINSIDNENQYSFVQTNKNQISTQENQIENAMLLNDDSIFNDALSESNFYNMENPVKYTC